MPLKRLTQAEMVYAYIKENGSISTWEAIKEFGITRLSARIHDLRDAGFEIESRTVRRKNRYGKYVFFSEYYLPKGE